MDRNECKGRRKGVTAFPRVAAARAMLRFSRLVRSLALVVMRPEDLLEFTRRAYARPHNWQSLARKEIALSGLNPLEHKLFSRLEAEEGKALVIGLGGGREGIYLAKAGFSVTGVDWIPELLEAASANAAAVGVALSGSVQEASRIAPPETDYDLIWISDGMYSAVPTRSRRIRMMKRLRAALNPAGQCICFYRLAPKPVGYGKSESAKRVFSSLVCGYRQYENGDTLSNDLEFVRFFPSTAELRSEFAAAGFCTVFERAEPEKTRGGSILAAMR